MQLLVLEVCCCGMETSLLWCDRLAIQAGLSHQHLKIQGFITVLPALRGFTKTALNLLCASGVNQANIATSRPPQLVFLVPQVHSRMPLEPQFLQRAILAVQARGALKLQRPAFPAELENTAMRQGQSQIVHASSVKAENFKTQLEHPTANPVLPTPAARPTARRPATAMQATPGILLLDAQHANQGSIRALLMLSVPEAAHAITRQDSHQDYCQTGLETTPTIWNALGSSQQLET